MTAHAEDPTRRDFLVVAAGAFAAIGGAASLWPLIDQMNPDKAALALSSVEVDLAPVQAGQAITISWRGKPIFIRNRPPEQIKAAEKVNIADLRDGLARNPMLPADAPATDQNRTVKGKENWLVLIGICTHLGCIPQGQKPGDARGEWGGWFCSCHGSQYDTAGRIRKGPAPRNLNIPPYGFITDSKIKIG